MPRPKKSRAEALKAAAAREAALAAALAQTPENEERANGGGESFETVEEGAGGEGGDSNKEEELEKAPAPASARKQSRATASTQSRLEQEDAAASRALDSLRSTRQKAISTPLQKPRFTQSRGAPGAGPLSTLQVQRSQDSSNADANAPPTNTRARNVPMAPMSVRKPMSTPRAEASMLALANFKRRGRAPSILGIGNDDDDMASLSSEGSFGDLLPDDESTPLPKMQAQRQLDSQLIAGNQQPLDLADGEEASSAADASSPRKRKRGDDEVQVPFSQPTDNITGRRSRGRKNDVIEVSSGEPSSTDEDSLPQLPAQETPATPSHSDSIMAPPMSSSPVKASLPAGNNAISSPTRARATKKSAGPGIAKAWGRTGTKKLAKPLDTSALANLLPKRRKLNQKRQIDVYSSDEAGSDADELSRSRVKRRRVASNASKKHQPQKQALAESNAASRNTRTSSRIAKINEAPKSGKNSRTYSRRSTEKENEAGASAFSEDEEGENVEEVGDTSFEASAMSEILAEPPKELVDARKKFAEVDEWTMDFEEVAVSSNSMVDAR